MTQYQARDQAFEDWLEEGDIPLPHDEAQRDMTIEGLRVAFNAGWKARKIVVDYGFKH